MMARRTHLCFAAIASNLTLIITHLPFNAAIKTYPKTV
jgi:hypothetical protein